MMHVILSVPIPSLEAKFMGHILSNIASMTLQMPKPNPPPDVLFYVPFIPGELLPLYLRVFFDGDYTLAFLPELVLEFEICLVGELSFNDPLFNNLFFYS